MGEMSTVKVNGGPFSANGVVATVIPPNVYTGVMIGSSGVGFPSTLAHGGAHEVLQDGTTGMQQANAGYGDYVAVSRPGVYLVTWTYSVTAQDLDGPATGFLGTVDLTHYSNLETWVWPGVSPAMFGIDVGASEGSARGGSSAILWMGTGGTIPDGFAFSVNTNRTDLVNTVVDIEYSVTFLQPGGIPNIAFSGG